LHSFSKLVAYLKRCREALNDDGILLCDLFGGFMAMRKCNKVRQHGKIRYVLEHEAFDLITNITRIFLHFRLEDGSWLKKAFEYPFRLWTIADIREGMELAGFKKTEVYLSENLVDQETEAFCDYERIPLYASNSKNPNPERPPLPQLESWNAYIIGLK